MPVTNPWLAGPAPEQRLDHDRLSERILNLLSSQNMCVLATAGPNGPLATPVRYYHLDFTLMITVAPNSPKMRNIEADRIVYTEHWLRREGFAPRQFWRPKA